MDTSISYSASVFILVNELLLIATLECGVPMGESDHSSLSVKIVLPSYKCSHSSSNTSRVVLDWVSADWQGYADFCFGVNWLNFLFHVKTRKNVVDLLKKIDKGNKLFAPHVIKKSNAYNLRTRKMDHGLFVTLS